MQQIKSDKGAILIISLWILAILTVLAIGFAYRMSIELKLTGYQIAKLKTFYLAKAGITKAISVLESTEATEFEALNQSWNNNPEIFDQISLGEGTFIVSYSSGESDFQKIYYGTIDEERKINVNYATRKMLESLPEISTEVAASIIDWRDKDNNPQPNGAEDSYYRSLPNPYHCKNGDFELVEELLWIKGVTPSLLTQIRDWITVYGDGRININTCEKEILVALGLDESLVQKIISFRKGIDNLEGTDDDNIFEKVETIGETLSNFRSLTTNELKQLNNLLGRNLLCVKSDYFQINSIGSLQGDRVIKKICAIVRVGKDQPSQIVYWHEE